MNIAMSIQYINLVIQSAKVRPSRKTGGSLGGKRRKEQRKEVRGGEGREEKRRNKKGKETGREKKKRRQVKRE